MLQAGPDVTELSRQDAREARLPGNTAEGSFPRDSRATRRSTGSPRARRSVGAVAGISSRSARRSPSNSSTAASSGDTSVRILPVRAARKTSSQHRFRPSRSNEAWRARVSSRTCSSRSTRITSPLRVLRRCSRARGRCLALDPLRLGGRLEQAPRADLPSDA